MGEEFTAKDFRTWAGTLIAVLKLAELGATEDLKQSQKVLAAVDHVAERLGNTRVIARFSYISPRVLDHYMEGSVVAYYGERLIEEVIAAERGGLADEEKALLDLLQRKLRRELEKAA